MATFRDPTDVDVLNPDANVTGDVLEFNAGDMEIDAVLPWLRPERTLTEKGKDEHIRLLRSKTISSLSACTKCRNELDRLMQTNDNLHLVKSCFDKFNGLYYSYKASVELYCSFLNPEEQSVVMGRSEERLSVLMSFRDVMVSWIQSVEKELSSEINDSASQKGSGKSHCSNRSTASSGSIKSSHTHEKAKLAELLAERSMLDSMKTMRRLQLDLEIAKSSAREKVFAEVEGQVVRDKVTVKTEDNEHNQMPFSTPQYASVSVTNDVPIFRQGQSLCETNVQFESDNHAHLQQRVLDPSAENFVPYDVKERLQGLDSSPYVRNHSLHDDIVAETQRQLASAILLPKPEIPKFKGDPTEFSAFLMAFDARVTPHTSSETDRLYYLDQQLEGEPKTLISGCMHMGSSRVYSTARDILCREYGDPYKVSNAYLSKVRSWPNLKHDDYTGLKEFSTYLSKCYHVMHGISHMTVLNHAPNMQIVVQKLPLHLQSKWRDRVTRLHMNDQGDVVFKDLVDFVDFAAKSANEPVYGRQALSRNFDESKTKYVHAFFDKIKKPVSKSSFATQVANNTPSIKGTSVSCYFCKKPHDIDDCSVFLKKSIQEKRQFVKDNKRCFGCFGLNHISKGCSNRRTCKVCQKRHPTVLHDDDFQSNRMHNSSESPEFVTSSKNVASLVDVKQVTTGATSCDFKKPQVLETVLQPILPVKVRQKGSDAVVRTYALLDNGSTGCFVTSDLKDRLAAHSTQTKLKLQTMNGKDLIDTRVVPDLIVSDLSDDQLVFLPNAYCKNVMPVDHDHIPKPEELKHVDYFKDVVQMLPPYLPDLDIGLLIGSNCSAALQPLEVIPAEGNGPFAVRYMHGWTINGPLRISSNPLDHSVKCNTVVLREHVRAVECYSPDAVLRMFELDFNEKDVGKVPGEKGYSVEDERFIKETEQNIHFVDGHFQIPLPFRDDSAMSCNKEQALKRLLWQKKKVVNDDTYRRDYVAFMDTILDKGYATKVPDEHLLGVPGRVWYLPHHGIYHPKKPGKIRVFDCSAKYNGLFLNDVLLQGPDLANSLIGVLTRFRHDKVAFMGDIEAMFHQVKVPPDQQNYLRFLWWPEGDINVEPKEYRMTVHSFGTISSPSVANFALKKTGRLAKPKYSEQVAETIERSFYVDDCLKSVDTDDAAIELIGSLRSACADGGFNHTKFTSNSKAVLSSIPKEHLSKQVQAVNLDYNEIPQERALGMQWDIALDCFRYTVKLQQKPVTRRGILSMVSSLYDPLGIVSPVLLPAKKILQDLCKEKSLDWDDAVEADCCQRWLKWLRELDLLKELTVERCLIPQSFDKVVSRQLHIFSDASSVGYGCSAYIRLFDVNGNFHTTLLLAKARLAPLKVQTIPRLELTAACVAVKLGQFLLREIDVNIDSTTYYTDSTAVLSYISSETGRFPVFVTNRVKLIHDYSKSDQWKYVSSEVNPADIASRGATVTQLLSCKEWFNGPLFLNAPASDSSDVASSGISEMVGAISSGDAKVLKDTDGMDCLIHHYSSWYRLKRAVSIYRRFFKFLQAKRYSSSVSANTSLQVPFSVEELEESEKAIVSFVQRTCYESEFAILSNSCHPKTTTLPRSSSVRSLNPVVIDGLLRVGGRLSRADIPDIMKYPVLLPRKHHVSHLIIHDIHEKLGHSGRSHVMATLRERYWITGLNSAVRSVLNKCVLCKRFKKPVSVQMMSDLPSSRVQVAPPFTYTGLDFFGPHVVKQGRKSVKRYGVIFTCLVSRAIHLETANSLDTDSFICALRRFISRRGPVKEISCDNGTNFTSGSKELSQSLDQLDETRVNSYLLKQDISWKFNPPAASHMGGSWERLIRSVRSVLNPLLYEFGDRIDDELYRTFLCEVEAILNSRPLTTVSSDPADVDPLTPNHLLMVKASVHIPPPGVFQRGDMYARRRWRRVQHLAEVFWYRWKREYLCSLQNRQKWQTPKRNFQSGDLVLIQDVSLPRSFWPLGRIVSTEFGADGIVRSVLLRTKDSELRRPVHKLKFCFFQ